MLQQLPQEMVYITETASPTHSNPKQRDAIQELPAQPAETPTLGTELPFLTQRKHPGSSDGCISFNNLPQAKCHCRVSSVLIILKGH